MASVVRRSPSCLDLPERTRRLPRTVPTTCARAVWRMWSCSSTRSACRRCAPRRSASSSAARRAASLASAKLWRCWSAAASLRWWQPATGLTLQVLKKEGRHKKHVRSRARLMIVAGLCQSRDLRLLMRCVELQQVASIETMSLLRQLLPEALASLTRDSLLDAC